jgi:hypothetical protein
LVVQSVQPQKKNKRSKKPIVIAVVVLIAIIATVATFLALTQPRTVLSFQVTFSVNGDAANESFEVPAFTDKIQVWVNVSRGDALWSAKILKGETEVFSHQAVQGEQTPYNGGWMTLPQGTYKFNFTTIGLDMLSATIKVTAKGGFW